MWSNIELNRTYGGPIPIKPWGFCGRLSTMFTYWWWQDIFMLFFHVEKNTIKNRLSRAFNTSIPRYCPHFNVHRHRMSSGQPQELLLQLRGHADAPRVPQLHRPQVQEEDWDDRAQAGQDGGGGAAHPVPRLRLPTPRDGAYVSWLQEPAALLRCHCECWHHCSQWIVVVEIKCHCSLWNFTVKMSLFTVNLCCGVNIVMELTHHCSQWIFAVELTHHCSQWIFAVELTCHCLQWIFAVN